MISRNLKLQWLCTGSKPQKRCCFIPRQKLQHEGRATRSNPLGRNGRNGRRRSGSFSPPNPNQYSQGIPVWKIHDQFGYTHHEWLRAEEVLAELVFVSSKWKRIPSAVTHLGFVVLLVKWPGDPVTWQGQLVPSSPEPRSCPLRCYRTDSALCSHVDLKILGTPARIRTPANVSSCPVQPAVVRVIVAVVVARGGNAAVRHPTRVLNADWNTHSWKNERTKNGTSITTCYLSKITETFTTIRDWLLRSRVTVKK